ncbi:MAG: hypothetical protein DRP68_02445 [Candidatus Omnitrophota bacterium]|nr:MAG: hypothetical protein DRP68_02445 [Candidatus Omnitrophota bacterium]RKY41010.1 MAG: hypothetical protein DRP81_08810 [Candidatus Omnitrophota bacterium]HDN86466.1 RluA family pseudouridine synthase [Candidatus Omnitrophota bacterium]
MKKPFEIVFQDTHLLVVNKIAKLLIQPTPKGEKITLTTLLQEKLGKRIFPCHRLDRETTGLIIYAKNKSVQKVIAEEFRRRKVEKRYIAFVRGKLSKRGGFLKGYILDKEGKIFGEKPKEAITIYKVMKRSDYFTVVKLKPITGRTNQLRIQLAHIGHPILGEDKYAFRRDFYVLGRKVNFNRLALHAFFISFVHPVMRRRISFKINLPQDMEEFLKKYSLYPLKV